MTVFVSYARQRRSLGQGAARGHRTGQARRVVRPGARGRPGLVGYDPGADPRLRPVRVRAQPRLRALPSLPGRADLRGRPRPTDPAGDGARREHRARPRPDRRHPRSSTTASARAESIARLLMALTQAPLAGPALPDPLPPRRRHRHRPGPTARAARRPTRSPSPSNRSLLARAQGARRQRGRRDASSPCSRSAQPVRTSPHPWPGTPTSVVSTLPVTTGDESTWPAGARADLPVREAGSVDRLGDRS